ncbi:MAG: hypothetical protein KDB61_16125, partial [Planctomycetes bacterium]|nr:hypothetical protein [Planctomycetota bacterium]
LGFQPGEPVGGSYQDLVPPFPEVDRWFQGQRTNWQEAGPVPQLLVLFSIQQNEAMPLHDWLKDLAARGEDYGLQVVAIAQAWDGPKLPAYLADHEFPGVVGVDLPAKVSGGLGATFDTFSVAQFNLPRLILIDPAGKVAWEGDPGFKVGAAPAPPYASYLDDPLAALLRDFRLLERRQWARAWRESERAKLFAGDWEAALPVLRAAQEFGDAYGPEVREAQSMFRRLELLTSNPEAAIAFLEAEQGHAAAPVLKAWFDGMQTSLGRDEARALGKLISSRQ